MSAKVDRNTGAEQHYLERELHALVCDHKVWQFIQAGSLDGIWYRDLEHPENEWISPEFWKVLGIDPITKPHSSRARRDLIHPEDLQLARANFKAHCANPDHVYDQIVRYRHADGSTVWIRCRGLAIRDDVGKPIRMLGAHNDVTALKRAEQAAIHSTDLTTPANRELQAFAYSSSHDLKSPTNTVRMLLQEARLALRNGDHDDADLMLSKAEATNDAMRSMVDNVLDYTRVVGATSEMTRVDLDVVVRDVAESMSADLISARAHLSVEPLGTVTGTEWQIQKMFQNLISNAIKFQPEGRTPEIQIRARGDIKGRVILDFADNGIGIPTDRQECIFDLFGRLHRSSSFEGSGIGLAFCDRVAKAHGSNISVHSELQRGTTFSFSLPKYDGSRT